MRQPWQRKKMRAGHADDWLLTYADVITLLLCFFAISLAVAVPKKTVPLNAPVPEKVSEAAAYVPPPPPQPDKLKEPDVLEGNLPFHGLEHVEAASDKLADKRVIEPDGKPIEDPERNPKAMAEMLDRVQTQARQELEKGDRLTTLEMDSAAFFAVGSATLSDAGKPILQGVADTIQSDKYKRYQVTVEGHTDDSPINTPQFPSNWELSTARAAAVVRFFLERGIPPERLRAAGYADTFPKAPNRDAAGNPIPANQTQNRRVVIKLEKVDKAG